MAPSRPDSLAWGTARGRWRLDFSQPAIMAIVNVTPDSFSDGGRFASPDEAVAAALQAEADGAAIIDLGAESSRPGSARLTAEEEWARLAPVLRGLAGRAQAPISIDTYHAATAEKALAEGAAMLNDIYAGRREPRILEVAARHGVPIVLMHMQGDPETMQNAPRYENVVAEVREFLLARARAAQEAGVARERVILDPGLGFGKTVGHNLTLIKRFGEAVPEGYVRLMALSRKGFLGRLLGGAAPTGRDVASAAAGALAIANGADIVRAHNVRLGREAALVAGAVREAADR